MLGETEPASPQPSAGMPAGPLEAAPRLQWAQLQALGQGHKPRSSSLKLTWGLLTPSLYPLWEVGPEPPQSWGSPTNTTGHLKVREREESLWGTEPGHMFTHTLAHVETGTRMQGPRRSTRTCLCVGNSSGMHATYTDMHTHTHECGGFPAGASGKELTCQGRRCKRRGFNPCVGEDPLGEGMATHSRILVWRVPWTEEPGGLQSAGLQRVGHD